MLAQIKIAERFKPFSHIPGASCVIPGSLSIIEAFPTLLRIGGVEWKIGLAGPVSGFTLLQDLEKGAVFVFGKGKEGYFRLRIQASDSGFEIHSEKGGLPSGRIQREAPFRPNSPFERLSLGSHKAQDWDQVQRRFDLKEILPILFCIAQKIPSVPPQPLKGTARLLEFPSERSRLPSALHNFCKAAFKGILVPRLIDDQYQGLCIEEEAEGDPFFLLQEGGKKVRSLFFHQNERRLAFLPHLPIPFDAGRMIGIQAPGIGEIDIEWTKKILRRVILRAAVTGEILLDLQKEIRQFRIGKKRKQKKEEPLLIEEGKVYLLDRFEK